MQIAVILVSYNTRQLLHNALRSVYNAQQPLDSTLKVIVVDNASRDGSAEMVTQDFPHATVIASPTNLGFTGGNNLALYALGLAVTPPPTAIHLSPTPSSAPPDYVLLLNPDTELAPDALMQLHHFMQQTPTAGLCGAHLRYGDGSFQHGAFRFPSLAQVALDFFPLTGLRGAQRLRDSRLNGRYATHQWQGVAAFPVDFVLGAAMFGRGAAIQEIGGLDDNYFMYCEEMDWALRMHEAGWGVYALPTAHVTHFEGQSTRQVRWEAFEQLWRSRLRFYAKHSRRYPPLYRAVLRLLIRSGAAWRVHQARQRFATGAATGTEAAREIQAYATITRF